MTTTEFAVSPTTVQQAQRNDYPKGLPAVLAIVTLCLVCAVLTMDVSLFGLLIEPIKNNLRLSDVQLGILQGPASSISYALCAIPAGLLIDRFNRMHMVFAAVAVWSLAMLSMAFATSFWVFVVAKIVIGIVMAVLLTAPFSLVADIVPQERRARATSVLVIGQYIGGAIGFLTGGLIFDALSHGTTAISALTGDLSPWRITYILFALPCILVLPFLILMKEPSRKELLEERPPLMASLRELIAYKWLLWPLFAGYAFQVIADSTVRSWLSPALMRLYHLTPGQFGGWIGGTVLVAGIIGSALGGWFAERSHLRNSKRVFSAVAAAIVVAASSCLTLMPSVPLLFGFYVAGTIASGIIATVLSAVMIMYIPNELRGLTSGIVILLAVGPGLAIGPTLVPVVTDLIGGPLMIGKAMALVGVPSGLLAALFFAFMRTDNHMAKGD